MPSRSAKQARFMRAVAHGWKPSRVKAPPRRVAEEFVRADKRAGKKPQRKFAGGVLQAARRAPPPNGILETVRRQRAGVDSPRGALSSTRLR